MALDTSQVKTKFQNFKKKKFKNLKMLFNFLFFPTFFILTKSRPFRESNAGKGYSKTRLKVFFIFLSRLYFEIGKDFFEKLNISEIFCAMTSQTTRLHPTEKTPKSNGEEPPKITVEKAQQKELKSPIIYRL